MADNRLVTLTGAGGAGKTRLAIEVAGQIGSHFPDGVWYADLAPITHPKVVPLTVARALGLPDQPGRSITETLVRFVRDRRLLVVLDNCEHLLEASAELVNDVLAGCSRMAILATSRETLMVAGEVNWQVPSLSLADEAVELPGTPDSLRDTDPVVGSATLAVIAEVALMEATVHLLDLADGRR